MDNSISGNNIEVNNSICNLSFLWIAIFKDGTKIEQLENGKEHLFKEVQQKFEDLVYFNLTDRKGHLFTVNLLNGLIGYNKLEFPYIESKEEKSNIRLIYFRRHRIEIGEQDLKEKLHTITYHLGLQYNDEKNDNHKIILQIDNEGNFIIGE